MTVLPLFGVGEDQRGNMKYILTVLITLAMLGVGALLFAWSGVYNIAATEPHWGVTLFFIDMLRDRSISAHANDIRVPGLDDAKLMQEAFSHYHEMCRLCHGAPGYQSQEFAKGLYPHPPSMTSGHIQKKLNKRETYWVVKHGIKLTGMPAFGPTHNEDQLWGLVALVREIPNKTPEEYRRQVEAMRSKGEEARKEH